MPTNAVGFSNDSSSFFNWHEKGRGIFLAKYSSSIFYATHKNVGTGNISFMF